MYTSLESSFSVLSYDTIIMMEGSRMTEQGQFVLCTFVQGKWGSYAHVKNHNEPNVAAIHLFWTIGFLPVPLQIVCNRSMRDSLIMLMVSYEIREHKLSNDVYI